LDRISKQQLARLITKPNEMKQQIKRAEAKARMRKQSVIDARKQAKKSSIIATSDTTQSTTNTSAPIIASKIDEDAASTDEVDIKFHENESGSDHDSSHEGEEGEAEADEADPDDMTEEERQLYDEMKSAADGGEAEGDAEGEIDTSELEAELGSEPLKHRESIAPPPPSPVTYDEYFKGNSATNFNPHKVDIPPEKRPKYVHVGRPMSLKGKHFFSSTHFLLLTLILSFFSTLSVEKKNYKGSVWMCDNYPLTVESLIEILDLVAPQKRHIAKLKEFVSQRMPEVANIISFYI
jgi:hypothetical protein